MGAVALGEGHRVEVVEQPARGGAEGRAVVGPERDAGHVAERRAAADRVEQIDQRLLAVVEHHGVHAVLRVERLAPRQRGELPARGDVSAVAVLPELAGERQELGRAVLELDAEPDHVGRAAHGQPSHAIDLRRLVEAHHARLVPLPLHHGGQDSDTEVLFEIRPDEVNSHDGSSRSEGPRMRRVSDDRRGEGPG